MTKPTTREQAAMGCAKIEQAEIWTVIGGLIVIAIAAVLLQICFGGAK